MSEPITPAEKEADIYWQQYAPSGYDDLLRANEEPEDDSNFIWLLLPMLYFSLRSRRRLPQPALRVILDQALVNARAGFDDLGQQLISGAINQAKWKLEMARIIKQSHFAGGASGRGGWGQLTGADRKFVQSRIDEQLKFLDGFDSDLLSKKQKLNGNFLRRQRMYGDAARGTHEAIRGRMHEATGFTEEGRELGRADHCSDCVAWSLDTLGWMPIGAAPALFTSVCRTNCHCNMIYRDTQGNVSR